MKTHEIKTSKGEFVVVDMEHNAYFQNTPMPDGYTTEKFIKLSEATELDAKTVVSNAFMDVVNRPTNLEILHSLLTSKGIDINNGNWYLFNKVGVKKRGGVTLPIKTRV